jgi:hypothetical protein
MKKPIILKATLLLVASIIDSYSMDERASGFLDSGSENYESKANISEKYLFTDWMCSIGKNLFNNKSLVEQQYFRQEVSQYSHQIADIICKDKKNKEIIAFYVRQISNDEPPMKESFLVEMEDQNILNDEFSIEIEKILYKIITGQVYLMEGKIVDSKFLLYWVKK